MDTSCKIAGGTCFTIGALAFACNLLWTGDWKDDNSSRIDRPLKWVAFAGFGALLISAGQFLEKE